MICSNAIKYDFHYKNTSTNITLRHLLLSIHQIKYAHKQHRQLFFEYKTLEDTQSPLSLSASLSASINKANSIKHNLNYMIEALI